MARKLISIIAGIISAFLIIGIIQYFGKIIFPPPTDSINPSLQQIEDYLAKAPLDALLFVLFSYLSGSLVAGFVSTIIDKKRSWVPALMAGLILTITGVINLLMIMHPKWFVILSLLTYIPFSLLGAALIKSKITYKRFL